MRGFAIIAVVIGALWALDGYVFDGGHSQAVWEQANYLGQKFSYEVQRLLNRAHF